MAKLDFVADNDGDFARQLDHFAGQIGKYAAEFELSAAELSAVAKDAAYVTWVLTCQKLASGQSQAWTKHKKLARSGVGPTEMSPPPAIAFPAAPPAVRPGIEKRYRRLVKKVKAHENYNASIGTDLRIEGKEPMKREEEQIVPRLDAPVVRADGVWLPWDWNNCRTFVDACELRVDRGDGAGERFLMADTTPGYLDREPLPKSPQKWTYRALFRKGDRRIGKAVSVSVNVSG